MRHRIPYIPLLLIVALMLSARAAAAQPRVEATVSATEIGLDERLVLTLTVEGASLQDVDVPHMPSTRGLATQQSRPSTSDEVRILNGDINRLLRFRWSFRPTATGTASIDAMEVRIEGRTIRTEPIRINVVAQDQRRRDALAGAEGAFGNEDLFIAATPSKRTAYVNEQIVVEYRLFFRDGIQLRQSRLAGSWDASGFWREELDVDLRPVPGREVVNGLHYQTIVLKRVAMFPTREGRLTIQPLRIETSARPRRAGDPLDAFFAFRNRFRTLELASPEVVIDVRPLPPDPPAGFSGAVGRFDVTLDSDDAVLLPGDPLTRRIDVRGDGNVAMIEPPAQSAPDAFDVMAPQSSENIDRSGRTLRGRKSFEYVAVPREEGLYELPPLTFSYFDPEAEAYRTVESASALVEVLSPDIALDTDEVGAPAVGPIQHADWHRRSRPLHRQPWAYAPPVGALLAWLLIPAVGRVRDRRRVRSAESHDREQLQRWHAQLRRAREMSDERGRLQALQALLQDVAAATPGSISGDSSSAGASTHQPDALAHHVARAHAHLEAATFAPGDPDLRSIRQAADALSRALAARQHQLRSD